MKSASEVTTQQVETVHNILNRKLIFVSGKGGVGKTLVSLAIARSLALKGRKTLWVCFEDPMRPPGELKNISSTLWELNCESTTAFEEYMRLKIGSSLLTQLFIQNKLIKYLAKAAPGIHELVLLGKVWYERSHYDHLIIDMPSTGYGLAMFQSTANFAQLFKGGPIHRDAEQMLETFSLPSESGQLIVALPEEMPLREALELRSFLLKLFPNNFPALLVNRRFPSIAQKGAHTNPDDWLTPVPASILDYVYKRSQLEEHNLKTWKVENIPYGELSYVPPPLRGAQEQIVQTLALELHSRKYL